MLLLLFSCIKISTSVSMLLAPSSESNIVALIGLKFFYKQNSNSLTICNFVSECVCVSVFVMCVHMCVCVRVHACVCASVRGHVCA